VRVRALRHPDRRSSSRACHGDYHQVTDEPQYINYPKLRAVTTLIGDVARQVGDLPHRVAVDGPRPDPKAQCRQ
jgi:hypothetical protein